MTSGGKFTIAFPWLEAYLQSWRSEYFS